MFPGALQLDATLCAGAALRAIGPSDRDAVLLNEGIAAAGIEALEFHDVHGRLLLFVFGHDVAINASHVSEGAARAALFSAAFSGARNASVPISPVSRLCRLVAATARRRLYRGVVALAEPLGAGARVNEGSEVFSGQSRE